MKTLTLYLFLVVVALSQSGSVNVTVHNDTGKSVTGLQYGYTGGGRDGDPFVVGTLPDMATGTTSTVSINWFIGSEGGTDGITIKVGNVADHYSTVGNSFIADGTSFFVLWGSQSWAWYYGTDTDIFLTYQSVPTATQDGQKTLWKIADTTLTADVFREGIDKVVANQKTQIDATSTSGGGGGGAGMTKTEFESTDTNLIAHAEALASSANPSSGDMSSASDTKKALMLAAMDAVPTPIVPNPDIVTSSPSMFVLSIPHVGTIDLDPSHDASIAAFLAFVKTLAGWSLIVGFGWWAWEEFQKLAYAAIGLHQARGNPVVGGTGAQATALVAAGLIAVVFIGIPAAYWTLVTTDTVHLDNPFTASSDMMSGGLYLLNLVFPYSLALLLLSEAFVIRKAGSTILLGANIVVKFIVP